MTIEINKTPENINVVMNGSLDTLASEQIEPQVQELEAQAATPISIDCSSLEYVASSGLRLLLRLRKAAKANGTQVTLLNVNDSIMEVLQVTHFDKMFIIK